MTAYLRSGGFYKNLSPIRPPLPDCPSLVWPLSYTERRLLQLDGISIPILDLI